MPPCRMSRWHSKLRLAHRCSSRQLRAHHLEAHPTVWFVHGEAAARVGVPEDVNGRAFEVPLGRPLQLTTKLAAPPVDLDTPTHFAVRANRAHPSRVTQETPTTWDSLVVIWIRRSHPNSSLELASAFIGTLSPLEPWEYERHRAGPPPEVRPFHAGIDHLEALLQLRYTSHFHVAE